MKNLPIFILIFLLISACCEDHSDIIPGQDFIPEEILTTIQENGQPIYEGLNPPRMEGRYLVSPLRFRSSNIENDFSVNTQFSDQFITFSNFDANSLTLQVAIEQGNRTGEGFGSFISGQGNNFTIYVEINITDDNGHRYLTTEVYSGTLEGGGIRDLHLSLFMIDDQGDPNNDLIENGQGRLFVDGDGFSPQL